MQTDYGHSLGGRLRAIRQQQGLSLQAVEERSAGRWKAVVVGSYERGDRAITVAKLAELADFYGIPVNQLLPDAGPVLRREPAGRKLVLNLEAIAEMPGAVGEPVARFVAAIQARRGDYNGRVLTIRQSDLGTLALLYNAAEEEVLALLSDWQVVGAAPESA